MKLYFYLCFWFCLLQLIGWLVWPFLGLETVILKVQSTGFYGNINIYAEKPYEQIAKIWNVSTETASLINRGIAILYFASLIVVVGSIFFIKKVGLEKMTKLVFVLSIVIIIILTGLPIDLFK